MYFSYSRSSYLIPSILFIILFIILFYLLFMNRSVIQTTPLFTSKFFAYVPQFIGKCCPTIKKLVFLCFKSQELFLEVFLQVFVGKCGTHILLTKMNVVPGA